MPTPLRRMEERLEHRGAMALVDFQRTQEDGEPLSRLRLSFEDRNFEQAQALVREWLVKVQERYDVHVDESKLKLGEIVECADEMTLSLNRESYDTLAVECVVYYYDNHDKVYTHVGSQED